MRRLSTYLGLVGGVILVAAMALVWIAYERYAVREMVEIAERHNVVLARMLANVVRRDLPGFFAASDDGAAGLDAELLDGLFADLTAAVPILKVKIYTPTGLTLYSTRRDEIGQVHSGSTGLSLAAASGAAQSELSFKETFSAFSGELFDRDVVETYVPVTDASGALGVFEIYSDMTTLRGVIDDTKLTLLLSLLAVSLVLLAALALVVRRALAPLRLASEHAARVGPLSPGVRLPTGGMPLEIRPLVDAINAALERMERALDAERQFAADAAHELLTPLTLMRANLDVMADRETAAELRQDVDAMSSAVADLLKLVELDAIAVHLDERTDLREVCRDVVTTMQRSATQQGKTIELGGPERVIMVRCNATALARALRNLVDNALAHTPAGSSVAVRYTEDGSVRVSDHGPGVPEDQRELIFHRFWRGPERRNTPGAGLGLAMVQRFAEVNGATVSVADAAGGGAVFTLRLARPPAPQQ